LGWSYNPSSPRRRVPVTLLSLLGCAISTALAAHQAGLSGWVWEPVFEGTEGAQIPLAWGSRLLAIPDTLLSLWIAANFLLVAISASFGGNERYRSVPWLVMTYGFAAGPLGLCSVALMWLSPVLFGAWSTLRLITIALSLAIMAWSMDEVLASAQYLRRVSVRDGKVWQAFWGRSAKRNAKSAGEVRHVGAL
jgi:hypothetical protein